MWVSVEFAMELDISPGNLYYHFKGKEVIVADYLSYTQSNLRSILEAPIGAVTPTLNDWKSFSIIYILMQFEKKSIFFGFNIEILWI